MSELDLRDYFAGKAIEGMLHRNSIPRNLPDTHDIRRSTLDEIAVDAYAIADALLAQRTVPVSSVRQLRQVVPGRGAVPATIGSTDEDKHPLK